MTPTHTWIAILGIVLSTILTRGGLLALGARFKLPLRLEHALLYAPACALAALIIPDIVLANGHMQFGVGNPRWVAALAAAALFLVTRSMLATIALGMAVFTLIRVWL